MPLTILVEALLVAAKEERKAKKNSKSLNSCGSEYSEEDTEPPDLPVNTQNERIIEEDSLKRKISTTKGHLPKNEKPFRATSRKDCIQLEPQSDASTTDSECTVHTASETDDEARTRSELQTPKGVRSINKNVSTGNGAKPRGYQTSTTTSESKSRSDSDVDSETD